MSVHAKPVGQFTYERDDYSRFMQSRWLLLCECGETIGEFYSEAIAADVVAALNEKQQRQSDYEYVMAAGKRDAAARKRRRA